MHDRKSANQRNRHGNQWNDRGSPGLQENDHHDDDQHDGLDQSVHHGMDRAAHEHGGIVGHVVVDALGKAFLELRHLGANGIGYGDGIAAGALEYGNSHGSAIVQH